MSKSMKSKPATAGKPAAIEVDEHELDAVQGGGGIGADSTGGGAGKVSFSDITFTTSANKASSTLLNELQEVVITKDLDTATS